MVPSCPDPVLEPGEQYFGQKEIAWTQAPESHNTGAEGGQAVKATVPVTADADALVELLPITPIGPHSSALVTHDRSAHSTVGAPAGRPGMGKQAF
jgi:hypothetical protein